MSDIYPAPAKVNLHLAITNVREDGYHALDTSFVYVDIGDILHITLADRLEVRCSDAVLSGEKNLVHQVLAGFKEEYNVQLGLDVHIEKRLPSQAGLGGGSSDAATALMVANRLWGVGCGVDELIQFAVGYGADIPCFLFGQASSAKGVGEQLTPYLGDVPSQNIVLAWPGVGVSTVRAFQHYDENKFHALTGEKVDATVRARSDVVDFELGHNDLEESASSLCEPLAAMLMRMREKSERAWMSGSGSACVAICDSSEQAKELVNDLRDSSLATWVHVGSFYQKHPVQEGCYIGA